MLHLILLHSTRICSLPRAAVGSRMGSEAAASPNGPSVLRAGPRDRLAGAGARLLPGSSALKFGPHIYVYIYIYLYTCIYVYIHVFLLCLFKSLRLRPPTPEAYGKTADVGTLCIPGSSQRRDPSAALLSSSDRSRLAALNVMLTPCPVP